MAIILVYTNLFKVDCKASDPNAPRLSHRARGDHSMTEPPLTGDLSITEPPLKRWTLHHWATAHKANAPSLSHLSQGERFLTEPPLTWWTLPHWATSHKAISPSLSHLSRGEHSLTEPPLTRRSLHYWATSHKAISPSLSHLSCGERSLTEPPLTGRMLHNWATSGATYPGIQADKHKWMFQQWPHRWHCCNRAWCSSRPGKTHIHSL